MTKVFFVPVDEELDAQRHEYIKVLPGITSVKTLQRFVRVNLGADIVLDGKSFITSRGCRQDHQQWPGAERLL